VVDAPPWQVPSWPPLISQVVPVWQLALDVQPGRHAQRSRGVARGQIVGEKERHAVLLAHRKRRHFS